MNVALLHALPFDERMWEPQLPALAGHEVYAPTLYGLGSSFDEWALGVLEQVPGKLVAVGASMGGYTACAIARLAPERLAGLVLVGSRADADAPGDPLATPTTVRPIAPSTNSALGERQRRPHALSPATNRSVYAPTGHVQSRVRSDARRTGGMEPAGLEPATSRMQTGRSPN